MTDLVLRRNSGFAFLLLHLLALFVISSSAMAQEAELAYTAKLQVSRSFVRLAMSELTLYGFTPTPSRWTEPFADEVSVRSTVLQRVAVQLKGQIPPPPPSPRPHPVRPRPRSQRSWLVSSIRSVLANARV